LLTLLCGCSVQRAMTASSARDQMVGMPKENILACIGVPQSRASEGNTERMLYAVQNCVK
jgi:hypothetical protein